MINEGLLDKISRPERLRAIRDRIKRGEKLSAFDLAVWYNVSINVIYRDINDLKGGKFIPADWEFTRKDSNG
jgi:predicted DNA-binding transcriptional regulator YafY